MTRAEALREANDLLDEFGDHGMFASPCWNCAPEKEYLKDSFRVVHCSPLVGGCGRFFYKGVHIAGVQYATE